MKRSSFAALTCIDQDSLATNVVIQPRLQAAVLDQVDLSAEDLLDQLPQLDEAGQRCLLRRLDQQTMSEFPTRAAVDADRLQLPATVCARPRFWRLADVPPLCSYHGGAELACSCQSLRFSAEVCAARNVAAVASSSIGSDRASAKSANDDGRRHATSLEVAQRHGFRHARLGQPGRR